MSHNDDFIVSLRDLSQSDIVREIEIGDSFFADQDQDEVLGGTLSVRLRAHRNAGDTFSFRFRGEGRLRLPCDRCLRPVEIPVDFDETVRVGYDDAENADSDLSLIPFSQVRYDVAWDLMESILLNLPTQRVHRRGECDADMLGRFSAEEDSDGEESALDA